MATNELAEIRARWAAATSGPWETGTAADGSGDMAVLAEVHGRTCILAEVYNTVDEFGPDSKRCVANATLMAHAPADIDKLLAEVERLQAENAKLECDVLNAQAHDKREHAFRQRFVDEVKRLQAENAALREALVITDEKVEAAHQWSGGVPHADIRAALKAAGMEE